MSGTRANIVKARGLISYGSELQLPEGSQRQATNVNIDEDGVITPRRGFNDFAGPTTGIESVSATVNQILEYKDALLRQYQNEFIEYEDTNGNFQAVNGSFKTLRDGYRTKWQEASSNLYFTSDEGIKKISETSQANLNADMIIDAGGVKAGFASGVVVPTVGGFLLPESKTAYRILYGTKDNNNNLIYGAPSSRFVVTNFNTSVSVYEESSITINTTTTTDEITDGDYFVYSTSNINYTVYFDTTGADATIPRTGDTIGTTYVRVDVTGNTDNNDNVAAILANTMASEIQTITVTLGSSDVVVITSTEEGDQSDIGVAKDSTGTSIALGTRIETATTANGSVTEGSSANVKVTGVVPSNATTDYFYQVYRSSIITVSTGLTINDLDPGDELNLVYESGLTEAEILAGEFEFTDTTPESFRAEALPLYTNEVTGEGILQANEVPPIALDLELFRNHMFYANTKEKHRLEFSIVSVDDFISDSTRIVIGNSDISRYYTFVGTSEVRDITITGTPTNGDYINLFSANDERHYYIWFDSIGDSSADPTIAGAIGTRIDVSDTPSNDTIATRIETALIDNIDVTLSVASNVITFTHTNNGYTTGITNGVGSDITIAIPSTAGTGELSGTDEGGDVLLSGLISVGQSIDETARSLVKVISKDPDSPVNAYYLSSSEDLPGNILLEARSLEDKTFYIAIEEAGNATIGGEFTPELPYSKEIEEFTGATTVTNIKLTGHGYVTGDEVFIGYFKDPTIPADPDSFSDVYSVTVIDVDNFSIEVATPATVVSFVPAFSSIFTADVESDNKVLPNRIYYSKSNEPEAVPIVNYIDVGSQDSEIKRILALRDNLFVLKDDGIYVVSGTSAPDWSVRLIDSTKILAPDSAVVLNNQIYCLTEQGVTRVTGSGAAIISRGIEDKIDLITNQNFDYSSNTFGVAYENDRAYIMFAPSDENDESAVQAFRYNIFEQTWSNWTYEATSGHVLSRDNTLYVGNADRNYISKERKNNDRTDHSDRNFSTAINNNGVSGTTLELSSLVDIDVNDVLVQEQVVSINFINNRMLKKMDYFDTGIPAGMLDTYGASTGSNMVTIVQNINDYLEGLDPANITAKSITLNNLRASTETLVDELNTATSITSIKTYKKPTTVYYEAYIEAKDTLRNQVTTHIERPFIEAPIEVYKGFTCTIEWNPQHFGDPSALKQVRYVTIMFDQNNFNIATAKFASDVAQAVTVVPFKGKGIAYWADLPYNDPNAYWGGVGNDIPFRNPVPRGKQKCRYISLTFEHKNAREYFRILGISGVVRAISDRGYR
jgi:hypothetical protein